MSCWSEYINRQTFLQHRVRWKKTRVWHHEVTRKKVIQEESMGDHQNNQSDHYSGNIRVTADLDRHNLRGEVKTEVDWNELKREYVVRKQRQ